VIESASGLEITFPATPTLDEDIELELDDTENWDTPDLDVVIPLAPTLLIIFPRGNFKIASEDELELDDEDDELDCDDELEVDDGELEELENELDSLEKLELDDCEDELETELDSLEKLELDD